MSCAVMALVLVPAALIVAAISNGGFSSQALLAAAVGGGVCWLAASLGLAATFVGNHLHMPVQAVLLGMLFRLGLPLLALLALTKFGGPLADASVLRTILGVYLIALIIETVLALRMTAPSATVKAASMKTS